MSTRGNVLRRFGSNPTEKEPQLNRRSQPNSYQVVSIYSCRSSEFVARVPAEDPG